MKKDENRSFSHEFLHRTHKLVYTLDKIADRVLRKNLDLTFSQLLILMAVVKHKASSQSMVAQFLNLTEAAVSRQMPILENKKLLVLKINKNNRRENKVQATILGIKKLNDSFKFLSSTFEPVISAVNKNRRDIIIEELDNIIALLPKN